MFCSVEFAIEVLDRLVTEHTAERNDLMRAALALSLHFDPQDAEHDDDAIAVVHDLERLAFGRAALSSAGFDRIERLLSQLRSRARLH